MEFLWVIAALFVIGTVGSIAGHRRDRRLRVERAGMDPDEFVDYFTRQGIPRSVAEIVRAFFQDWKGILDFPVMPGDNIGDVYGIVDEDVDDTFYDLLELCGRRDKPDEAEIGGKPIITVEDLVTLIAQLVTPEKCETLRFDDPIDFKSRAELALLLRRFAIGRITYLEFEQGVNTLPWNRRDGAIPGIVHHVRKLLNADTQMWLTEADNFVIQKRIPVDREMKRALARMVMLLYSDMPYQWRWQKHITLRETVFLLCVLAASAALVEFGHVWAAVASFLFIFWLVRACKWEMRFEERFNSGGFYPFANSVHFLAARWRPRLLNRAARKSSDVPTLRQLNRRDTEGFVMLRSLAALSRRREDATCLQLRLHQ